MIASVLVIFESDTNWQDLAAGSDAAFDKNNPVNQKVTLRKTTGNFLTVWLLLALGSCVCFAEMMNVVVSPLLCSTHWDVTTIWYDVKLPSAATVCCSPWSSPAVLTSERTRPGPWVHPFELDSFRSGCGSFLARAAGRCSCTARAGCCTLS